MAALEILGALTLAGVMGMVGQGARAVIGLKKLSDANALKDPGETDIFIASRLVISLFIGFIAGVAAAVVIGLEKVMAVGVDNLDLLIGLAAAGYAGTDAIEAFLARVGPPASASAAPPQPGSAPTLASKPMEADANLAFGADVEASVADVKSEVASLKSMVMANTLLAPADATVSVGDILDDVTPDMVKKMFVPGTPLSNITKYLPAVIGGLRAEGLADRPMLLMALATIRAETEGFVPISEGKSKFNTAKTPFDLYDKGTKIGGILGNTVAGDGPRFRGRGFVQLTGRDNYTRIGKQLSLPLSENPELANDSQIAGRILARFLHNKAAPIRAALAERDLKKARRLVNGGSHGLDRFIDAFEKGEEIFT
ncbi:MAG: hypothetical protein H7X89_12110 [Rhizobiales bacterium]|nr:hypothetical protein [Hyphomicrobiales bacterium]